MPSQSPPEYPHLVSGSCDCGRISYSLHRGEFTPPPGFEHIPLPIIEVDHCQRCRTTSGGLFQTWYIVQVSWARICIEGRGDRPAEKVLNEVLEIGGDGEVEGGLRVYRSSENVARGFCGKCGTGLFFAKDRPDLLKDGESGWKGPLIDFSVGSLCEEDFEKVRPEYHGWWGSGVEWVKDWCRSGPWGSLKRCPQGDPRVYTDE